jgi:hypothetical protein
VNFIEIKTQIYKIISKNGWLRPLLGEKYFEIWYKYIRNSIFENLKVRTGPFAGMKYPQAKSAGSSLLPKILGSYEKELSELIEQICTKEYSEIVDVGCAEGYYAVGLATRLKKAKVFGFDTNSSAIELSKEMAYINDVQDRCVWGSFCDENTLKSLPLTRALIVCDCEGYEKELFTDNIVTDLANHDLLIEVHDLNDPTISPHLRDVFKNTHTIDVYSSISDSDKALTYSYKELDGLPFYIKKRALAEGRREIMEWFYLRPKKVVS